MSGSPPLDLGGFSSPLCSQASCGRSNSIGSSRRSAALRSTPMGDERLARLAAVDRSAEGRRSCSRRPPKRSPSSRSTGLLPLRASAELPQILDALAVEGRALERAAAAGAGGVPRFGRRDARRHPPRRRVVPAARSGECRRGLVQGRDRADARQDRSVGRRRRPREPGAEDDPRAAAQAAHAAARHARVVPARQGHGEVPAGSGRHRAERPLRAGRQGRASQRHSRHRARRVDERRQPVSRAAQHRRDQQRHRRARGAGSRGGPPHPAGADRRVPRARRRPAADDRGGHRARRPCRRAPASRSRSTASSRRCRPTARSSCRRRGIRC